VNTTTEFDFGKISASFYRQKEIIIAVFLVVSTLTVYLATTLPPIYRSSTLILVTPQRVPTSFVASTVTMELNERIQSIREEILSRTQLETIIRERYPTATASLVDDRIQSLRRKIRIDLQRTNVFQLSYESESPHWAQRVTSRLASLFINQNLQVRERQAIGTKVFINTEAERLRSDLEKQETEVNRYKAANRFELPDQLDSNLRTMEQLRVESQTVNTRFSRLQERKALLQKQLVEADLGALDFSGFQRSDAKVPVSQNVQLQIRKRELEALLGRYSAKHPDVVQLRKEIHALETDSTVEAGASGAQGGITRNPMTQVLQKQIAELDAEITLIRSQMEALRNQIGVYQTRIDNTPVRAIVLSKISRTYEITLKKYQDLLAKGLESQLSENMEKTNKAEQFQIVDPAYLPLKPVSPDRRIIIVLIGLLAGLGAGFGLAFLWESLDTSFKNNDDLAGFSELPVLAVLPAASTRGTIRSERKVRAILVLASLGTVVLGSFLIRFLAPLLNLG